MIRQFPQAALEVRCDIPGAGLDNIALAQDAQGCQAGGTADGMAGVGQAMGELAAVGKQHVGYAVAHHHAAQGDVAIGNALGEGQQVGLEVVGLAAEPVAGAAKATDDLVHHQQDIPLAADALDLGPVGIGGNDHATGALYGFGDKCRDLVLAQLVYLRFQLSGHAQPERRGAVVAPFDEPVGLVDMVYIVQAVGLGVHGAHAAQGGGGDGRAVVGVAAADDVFLLRLAQQAVVTLDQAYIGVVGLGAGIGKEHVVELRRRDFHQRPGQFHRGLVGTLEKIIVEGQLLQLGVDRILDALLAIPQVAAPEPRHAIQHFVAVAVIDIDVFGPGNDAPALFAVILQVGERVEVVSLVQLL